MSPDGFIMVRGPGHWAGPGPLVLPYASQRGIQLLSDFVGGTRTTMPSRFGFADFLDLCRVWLVCFSLGQRTVPVWKADTESSAPGKRQIKAV